MSSRVSSIMGPPFPIAPLRNAIPRIKNIRISEKISSSGLPPSPFNLLCHCSPSLSFLSLPNCPKPRYF